MCVYKKCIRAYFQDVEKWITQGAAVSRFGESANCMYIDGYINTICRKRRSGLRSLLAQRYDLFFLRSVVEQVDDMNTFYKNLTAHLRETLPRIDAGEFFWETSEKNLRAEMKKSYNNECTGDAPGAVGWVTFAFLYCSIFRVWCKYSLYTPLFPYIDCMSSELSWS